jgi:hypothetical protein
MSTATDPRLTLMSKPRLIQRLTDAEKRAQQQADLAAYWRNLLNGVISTGPKPTHDPECVESTRTEAERILRGLPVDPMAEHHRDTLRRALNGGGQKRRQGARCTLPSGAGVCDRLLNVHGFCPNHERAATNRARAAA